MTDWKQRALDALHRRELDEERNHLRANRERAKQLKKLLKRVGVEVEPEKDTITVDGVTFGMTVDCDVDTLRRKDRLAIIGTCPTCKATTYSSLIDTEADLGAQLEDFRPYNRHY